MDCLYLVILCVAVGETVVPRTSLGCTSGGVRFGPLSISMHRGRGSYFFS